jgi:hypothetical protein
VFGQEIAKSEEYECFLAYTDRQNLVVSDLTGHDRFVTLGDQLLFSGRRVHSGSTFSPLIFLLIAVERMLNGNALMNMSTEWRLESSPLPCQTSSSAPNVQPVVPPVRPEVSSMYSPLSVAFFGVTGTAVGAAGVTGSFGGLTSLVITVAVLAVLFAAVLAGRLVARRRLNP